MVRGLGVAGCFTEKTARVVSGVHDHALKKVRIDVVRATERREGSSRLQQLQRAQVDFFVAAQGVRNARAIAGKAGRIENYYVVAWNYFFVRAYGGLGLEPVEYVGRFEGGFFLNA